MKAASISIDASEVIDFARAWRRAPDMVIEEILPAMREGSLLVQREVQEATPVGASGGAGLKGSTAAREPAVLADQVIGVVGTPLAYAVPVELGTRPHFPPVQPLVDWARHKLGLSQPEAERAGHAIAWKISREGTKGAFMFRKGLAAAEPTLQRIFLAAARRLRDRLADIGGGGR